MKVLIWYSKITKKYYSYDLRCCINCFTGFSFNIPYIYYSEYNSYNRLISIKEFCFECYQKTNFFRNNFKSFWVIPVRELPPHCSPYIESGLYLIPGKIGEGEILDYTQLSGKPDCTFSISETEKRKCIPISEFLDTSKIDSRIEELDSPVYDITGFLENVKNSVLMIEQEEINLIEEPREEPEEEEVCKEPREEPEEEEVCKEPREEPEEEEVCK